MRDGEAEPQAPRRSERRARRHDSTHYHQRTHASKRGLPMDALRSLPRVDAVAAHAALDDARRRLGAPRVMDFARRAVDDAREHVEGEGRRAAPDARGRRGRRVRARRALGAARGAGAARDQRDRRRPAHEPPARAAPGQTRSPRSQRPRPRLHVDRDRPRDGVGAARAARSRSARWPSSRGRTRRSSSTTTPATRLAADGDRRGGARDYAPRDRLGAGSSSRSAAASACPTCARARAAELVEVGTTNKTRLDDYARALDAGGVAAILRVHPGEFRQTGFVARPRLAELAALARARGVPLVKDLGGGAARRSPRRSGSTGELLARESVETGCDPFAARATSCSAARGVALTSKRAAARRSSRAKGSRSRGVPCASVASPLVALEATLAAMPRGSPSTTCSALRAHAADADRAAPPARAPRV